MLLAIVGFISVAFAQEKASGSLAHHRLPDGDLIDALQRIQHITFSKAEPINKTALAPLPREATGGPTYASTYATDMLSCWDADGDNKLSSAEI